VPEDSRFTLDKLKEQLVGNKIVDEGTLQKIIGTNKYLLEKYLIEYFNKLAGEN
jgi:hypothetical protein